METIIHLEDTAIANFSALQQKVNLLLSLDKITREDTMGMTDLERQYLSETVTARLRQLSGAERDEFLDKIDMIIPGNTKHEIWEYNQVLISKAVSKLMGAEGFMPTRQNIADETGLSRQTIYNHIKNYKQHPEFIIEMEQYKFAAVGAGGKRL